MRDSKIQKEEWKWGCHGPSQGLFKLPLTLLDIDDNQQDPGGGQSQSVFLAGSVSRPWPKWKIYLLALSEFMIESIHTLIWDWLDRVQHRVAKYTYSYLYPRLSSEFLVLRGGPLPWEKKSAIIARLPPNVMLCALVCFYGQCNRLPTLFFGSYTLG